MQFNNHYDLAGLHAEFPASSSSWLRYDDNKVLDVFLNRFRKELGTEIHEYAASQITLSQKVTSVKNLIQDITTYIYAKYSKPSQTEYKMKLIQYLRQIPRDVFEIVKLHINDAIGFKMSPEVVLYYSDNFFGTADAISFRDNVLRIHDLKTGSTPVSMDQLEVYAALFCLEYRIKPKDIIFELTIYQNVNVVTHEPAPEEIVAIMDKIIHINKLLERVNKEEV